MNHTTAPRTSTDQGVASHGLWRQTNVAFPHWETAEHTAVTRLVPDLTYAQQHGLITDWFFVRKNPCWRVRYRAPADTLQLIRARLQALTHPGPGTDTGRIAQVTHTVYEPEQHAFGGADAMTTAHRLFTGDTRHLLAYLTGVHLHHTVDQRRELAVLLTTELLHAARLDWYEQGDVWARVVDHRADAPPPPPAAARALTASMRRLMTADTTVPRAADRPLAFADRWFDTYAAAGNALAEHCAAGRLQRGLRAVLAHHVIFTFNRFGLPYTLQAALAAAAKTTVFGPTPTTPSTPTSPSITGEPENGARS